MLKTSIGFHTLMFSTALSGTELRKIKDTFTCYCERVGGMKIYPDGKNKTRYKVKFTGKDKGVSWVLKFYELPSGYKFYYLDTIINPKILIGEDDYIVAANETHVDKMEKFYNTFIKQISDEIPPLSRCELVEVHYCINFMLTELRYHEFGCSLKQMVRVLKRANIPNGFFEILVYDKNSHRFKSYENSLYLISNPITINCYDKEQEMKDRNAKHPERKLDIESAGNVIRFEVQCKRQKIKDMQRKITGIANDELLISNMDITKKLLSDEVSKWIIYYYFKQVIMGGDYYERQRAVEKIESCCRSPKRELLIAALELVGNKRGIHNAHEYLKEKVMKNEAMEISPYNFVEALKELPKLGINPVTLPRPWGIVWMPGLLNAFEMFTESLLE